MHSQPDKTGSKNDHMVFAYVLMLALFLFTDKLYHDKKYLSIAFADRHILHKINDKPTKYRREFLLFSTCLNTTEVAKSGNKQAHTFLLKFILGHFL